MKEKLNRICKKESPYSAMGSSHCIHCLITHTFWAPFFLSIFVVISFPENEIYHYKRQNIKFKHNFGSGKLTGRPCRSGKDNIKMVAKSVHSVEQKSIGLEFSKSRTGSNVRYSCHHNSSRFTFPHICEFSVFHSLQSITPRMY